MGDTSGADHRARDGVTLAAIEGLAMSEGDRRSEPPLRDVAMTGRVVRV